MVIFLEKLNVLYRIVIKVKGPIYFVHRKTFYDKRKTK